MCDCIERINEKLGEHNSRLSTTFMVRDGELKDSLVIQTEKINPRNREKMGAVPTFCPFCGVKLEG